MAALKPPFRAEDMEGLYKKVIRGMQIFINDRLLSENTTIIFLRFKQYDQKYVISDSTFETNM